MRKKKKTFGIIVIALFAISVLFIVIGVLVVDNSFYIVNNTTDEYVFQFVDEDGKVNAVSVESGDSLKIYEKKILRFSNSPEKSDYFINECKILNYQQASEEFIWEIRTKKRENVYYYIIN